jgi:hypothetical protein
MQSGLDRDLTAARSTGRNRDALVVARAYQRCLLNDKRDFHEDGRIVLGDLLRASEFFGAQYVVGKPERTLELAVKRAMIIHILTMLGLSEAHVLKQREVLLDD